MELGLQSKYMEKIVYHQRDSCQFLGEGHIGAGHNVSSLFIQLASLSLKENQFVSG